jgi:hypothetical protein
VLVTKINIAVEVVLAILPIKAGGQIVPKSAQSWLYVSGAFWLAGQTYCKYWQRELLKCDKQASILLDARASLPTYLGFLHSR